MLKTYSLAIALAAFGGSAMAEEYTRIMTEAQYRELVVERANYTHAVTHNGAARVRTHPDGSISGSVSGAAVTGTWRWAGSKFCSTVTIGDAAQPESCKIVALSGNRLLVRNENDGKVQDTIYTLE